MKLDKHRKVVLLSHLGFIFFSYTADAIFGKMPAV